MREEISQNGASPVSLTEAKRFMKIDTSADDSTIALIIEAVTNFAERHTGRELRRNEWLGYPLTFDDMVISKNPVQQVTKIQYVLGGHAITLSSSTYELFKDVDCSTVVLSDGSSWPDFDPIVDPIQVSFTTSPHRVTAEIKLDMLRHITYWYENRGDDQKFVEFEGIDFYRHSKFPNI